MVPPHETVDVAGAAWQRGAGPGGMGVSNQEAGIVLPHTLRALRECLGRWRIGVSRFTLSKKESAKASISAWTTARKGDPPKAIGTTITLGRNNRWSAYNDRTRHHPDGRGRRRGDRCHMANV